MATELAKAYVQIVPSARGISGSISSAISGEAGAAGKAAGGIISGSIGGALTKVVSAGVSAMGDFAKSSIGAGSDFDKAMSQVAATGGKTMQELESEIVTTKVGTEEFTGSLRDFAQYMGSTTAFSATQAAEALNYMALAGYDAQTSVEMLPSVLDLAAAGGMELATASDMVTDVSSALGLSLEDTATMVDQMAMASSKSNTSVAQLGDAMLTIGATARGVAGGTQELSTLLGVLADNGIKGAEGGTHLRNVLLSLQTPTTSGTAALEELGLSYQDFYDAAGNMRSIPEIMQQLSGAMEGMTQQSKDAIVSGIFNKTDLASVNAMLNTSTERWNELSGYIGEADDSAKEMAETQLDNLAGDVTLFQSALEGAKIAVSDKLVPSLRGLVQFGSDSVSKLTEAFKSGGLSGVMGELGNIVTEAVKKLIAGLPEIVNAGMALIESLVDGIFEALPLFTNAALELIPGFLDRITAGLPSLVSGGVQMLTSIAKGISDNFPKIVTAAINLVGTLISSLIEQLPQVLMSGLSLLSSILQGILDNLPLLIDTVITLVNQLVTTITENLPAILEMGVELLSSLVTGILENLPHLIEAAFTIITTLAECVLENLPTIVEKGMELLSSLIKGIVDNLPMIVSTVAKLIAEFVKWIGEHLGEVIQAGIDILVNVGSGIIDAIPQLLSVLPEVFFSIIDAFASVNWLEVGGNILSGIGKGISGAVGGVVDVAKNAADSIFNGVKDFFSIGSPSKLMRDEIGQFLPMGIAEGIEDTAYTAKGAMGDMAAGVLAESRLLTEPIEQGGFSPGTVPALPDAAELDTENAAAGDRGINELINLLKEARHKETVVQFSIGNMLFEEAVVDAMGRVNYRSGGR